MDACPPLTKFERFMRNELSDDERRQLEAHTDSCVTCREVLSDGMRQNRFLNQMKAALPSGAQVRDAAGSAPGPATTSSPRPVGVNFSDEQTTPIAPPTDYLPEIEGYRIERRLGRGGMGIVYLAEQTKLGRLVALKLLPAIVSSSHPQTIERFQREASAAARLHHRNIISIFDFGESRDGYYYAMEYIDGLTLNVLIHRLDRDPTRSQTEASMNELLKAPATDDADTAATQVASSSSSRAPGRFYFTQIAHWMAELADALHYAHLGGLIHRDIKPSNIMLSTDGRIHLLDFGLVKTSDEDSVTQSGSLVGTYRYMSPEQLGAKRIPIDLRTDIYSLGATLYELLTLKPAFPETHRPALLSAILFDDPTAPRKCVPSIPAELETICCKAMEKPPTARYQSAGEMAEDLRRYLNDQPILARRTSLIGRGRKFARRHRHLLAAVGTIFAIALVAAGYNRWQDQQHAAALADEKHRRTELTHQVDIGRNLFIQGQASTQPERIFAGHAQMSIEAWDTAEQILEEVLAEDPHHLGALLNLAIVKKDQYYIKKQPALLDEALAHLDAARPQLDDPHRQVGAMNVQGVIYRTQRQLGKAEATLQEALALNETSYQSNVWANLGPVHALQGRLTEARSDLQQAVKLSPNPAFKTVFNLAVVDVALATPEATESLELAWQIADQTLSGKAHEPELLILKTFWLLQDPTRPRARNALALLDAAEVINRSEAVSARIAYPRSLALLNSGSDALALTAARSIRTTPVERAGGHLVTAAVLARRGEDSAARHHLEEADAHWPTQLSDESTFLITEQAGLLWIERGADLHRLRQRVVNTLNSPVPDR